MEKLGLTRLDGDGGGDWENADSTASFIGIIFAISGNVLISLALNCQKLAHKRLERDRRTSSINKESNPSRGSLEHIREETSLSRSTNETANGNANVNGEEDDEEEDEERTRVGGSSQHHSPNSDDESEVGIPFPGTETPSSSVRNQRPFRDRAHMLLLDTQPLLVVSNGTDSSRGSLRSRYGTTENGKDWRTRAKKTPNLLTRIFTAKGKARADDVEASAIPVDVHIEGEDSRCSTPSGEPSSSKNNDDEDVAHEENESDYLKSKLWWLGFLLMNVGEMGNFISYAFAPASVVAPLGTFALIANCFFAPLMLKERFRKRDLLGILLAVLGAITVVLSASSSDRRLDPGALIHAITQKAFIVLAALYVVGAAVLVSLSSRRVGREHVWVDIGACALFGGFTVLSTKAFSSLLTMEWAAVFKEWITYPVLVVLVGTGVGQIKYLNRALMKFDSKVVIPAQFVFFNISAIVGSAVLYQDFRSASLHQMVTFLYGCLATFAGVFMLTWGNAEQSQPQRPGTAREEEEIGRPRPERAGSRAQLVLPANMTPPRPMPLLRAKTSSLTLSPAQRALLVRTLTDDHEDNE